MLIYVDLINFKAIGTMAMTREEYQQLVKSAVSFQEMSAEIQARILAAEGEEMDKYIQMFEEEKELMAKAYQSFQQETDKIVVDYKVGVQKEKRDKLAAAESGTHDREISKAEDLLKKL